MSKVVTNKEVSSVHQPHDHLIKKILSNPLTAKEVLSLYLSSNVIKLTDLDHLELQRDSFIDDQHRVFAVDLLYKTKFQEDEGYIWILLEHQRTPDPWLPVRIFKYIGTIWDHIRKTQHRGGIPLIYPMVIYNGERPYPYPLILKEMIEPEVSRTIFRDVFEEPMCLVDLASLQDETLRKQAQNNVRGIALLMTLKHAYDRNLQVFFENDLVYTLKQLDRLGYRDDVCDLLYYLLQERNVLDKEKFWDIIHQEFSEEVEDKLMSIAEQLIAEGREEGRVEGRVEGHLEGRMEGHREGRMEALQEMVRRLLQKGNTIQTVSELTGLSIADVKSFKLNQH